MDPVPWLSPSELRAWRSLVLMQMQLEARLARQLLADSDLSYPDYQVLAALTDQPDGRMRLFEMGKVLGWEKSRLSHHIRRMTGRRLVNKEPCNSDKRGAYVVVTRHGQRVIEAAAPGHVSAVRQLFIDRLTPEQLATIGDAAETVLAALGEPTINPRLSDLP